MTTTVVKTVGVGGDYSTWQAWADACPADLRAGTGTDQIWQGQGLNQTFTAAAGAKLVSISGQAVDASHYLEMTAAPGCSFQDNIGSGPVRADSAYGCYLTSAQDFQPVVYSATNYTRISKLMVKSTATAGSAAVVDMGGGASGTAVCLVDACIIEGNRGQTTAGVVHLFGSGQIIQNSVVTLLGSGQGCITAIMNGAKAYNCTIAAPSDLATKPTNINVGAYASPTFQNCALFGATNMWTAGSAPSFATCMTDVASPPAGNTMVSYSAAFVSTAAATRDYRLPSSSPLNGATAQNDPTHAAHDVLGVTRSQPPDIGAVEYVASSNVTVSITGQKLTLGQGIVTASGSAPSVTVSIAGQRATTTPGAVSTVLIATPVGQALTATPGTLAPSTAVSLTGSKATSTPGTVTSQSASDVTVAIIGQKLTAAPGALGAPAIDVTATGRKATATGGALQAQVEAPSSGDVTVAITGQRLTATSGVVSTSGGDPVVVVPPPPPSSPPHGGGTGGGRGGKKRHAQSPAQQRDSLRKLRGLKPIAKPKPKAQEAAPPAPFALGLTQPTTSGTDAFVQALTRVESTMARIEARLDAMGASAPQDAGAEDVDEHNKRAIAHLLQNL